MNQSESIAALAKALIKAKAEFLPVVKGETATVPTKTGGSYTYKFATLAGAYDATDNALLAHGLVVVQPTRVGEDGKTVLVTTLIHESGEWLAGEYPVTASQAGPQGEGSGMTYARRYALLALLGIAPEDDDGEAAQRGHANGNGNGARPAARAATAPAGVPSANDLRARILKVGEAKRMTKDEITADFANWAEGRPITAADAGTLTRYLDALNAGTP